MELVPPASTCPCCGWPAFVSQSRLMRLRVRMDEEGDTEVEVLFVIHTRCGEVATMRPGEELSAPI